MLEGVADSGQRGTKGKPTHSLVQGRSLNLLFVFTDLVPKGSSFFIARSSRQCEIRMTLVLVCHAPDVQYLL